MADCFEAAGGPLPSGSSPEALLDSVEDGGQPLDGFFVVEVDSGFEGGAGFEEDALEPGVAAGVSPGRVRR